MAVEHLALDMLHPTIQGVSARDMGGLGFDNFGYAAMQLPFLAPALRLAKWDCGPDFRYVLLQRIHLLQGLAVAHRQHDHGSNRDKHADYRQDYA
jgi:hypothetical protein